MVRRQGRNNLLRITFIGNPRPVVIDDGDALDNPPIGFFEVILRILIAAVAVEVDHAVVAVGVRVVSKSVQISHELPSPLGTPASIKGNPPWVSTWPPFFGLFHRGVSFAPPIKNIFARS